VQYGTQAKGWRIAPESPHVGALQRELGCSRLVAHLLTQRGIGNGADARRFLDPSYDDLADPMLLPDAVPAVRRLTLALDRRERIYVHGDYDGDGVTAAALWTRLLQMLGGDVMVHVPHRRHDGYDFRAKFIETARQAGAGLIVTADCGIQRHQEVEAARQAGIDVIITDHHEVGSELPNAVAVVDPHRSDSQYPFRDLAAVGVAYRLGEALVGFLRLPVDKYRAAFAELAAIGTITDIMPLLGDNRVFVRTGLAGLGNTHRVGLKALMNLAGLNSARAVTSQQVSFVIGPRLNAVGRVADPRTALDLLLTRDADAAARLAAELEAANVERRSEEARILAEAEERLGDLDGDATPCLVLDDSSWHPGVIGVVANRLCERHARPTILVATDPETGLGRGSGRSVASFDLHAALADCGALLAEYGGHALAAGFSIETANIERFREAFRKIAANRLTPRDLQPVLVVDAALAPHEVTRDLMDELAMLEPWGHANAEPTLIALGVEVRDARRMGREGQHLKLHVAEPGCDAVEAVLWNAGPHADSIGIGDRLDVCFSPQVNTYNGRERMQLRIEDARPAGPGNGTGP
jgi:single-stranded-DNA-specific exonuclease